MIKIKQKTIRLCVNPGGTPASGRKSSAGGHTLACACMRVYACACVRVCVRVYDDIDGRQQTGCGGRIVSDGRDGRRRMILRHRDGIHNVYC